jgi:hypothetical protein
LLCCWFVIWFVYLVGVGMSDELYETAMRVVANANLGNPVVRLDEALDRIEELEAKLAAAVEALIWCSGSADFNEGGFAREGWLKICEPILRAEKEDE